MLSPASSIGQIAEGVKFLGVYIKGTYITLQEEKRQRLQQRISAVCSIRNGIVNPELAIVLNGIRSYYGQLLRKEELIFLDAHLKHLLSAEVVLQKKFRTLVGVLKSAVQSVRFITIDYEGSKAIHVEQILGKTTREVRLLETLEVGFDIEKNIQKKKREYEKKAARGLELIVSKPGVYLGSSKKGITVKEKGVDLVTAPTENVKHITILSRGVSVSSNLIHRCIERDIPLDFVDDKGKTFARIYSGKSLDSRIWRAQTEAFGNGKAQHLTLRFVAGKMRNQQNTIKYFGKYYARIDSGFEKELLRFNDGLDYCIQKAETTPIGGNFQEYCRKIMAIEAEASVKYWYVFGLLVSEKSGFSGRERRGAKDITNSLLNYGYGILYARVWDAILKSRLNPTVSYLHTADRDGDPTLVYDLIEEFRQPIVDRVVIALITKNSSLKIANGNLDNDTRKLLTAKVLERLNSHVKKGGHRISLADVMRLQAKQVAEYLLGKKSDYKPYCVSW